MGGSLVSIIVPCYNQAHFLTDALDSVLAQSYLNWECIIVNDGSPDSTEEIAKLYCEKDSRFNYLFKDNGGLSSARNAGITKSSGKYILPLDADDRIGEKYLEEAVTVLDGHKEVKLVYCKAEFFGRETGIWSLHKYNYFEILLGNMIFCSALFRRKDFDKTKGYNINMLYGWEDWDFWISLLNPSDEVYCIPKIHFYYRRRNDSMVDYLDKHKAAEMRIQIYLNHIKKYTEAYGDPILSLIQIRNLRYRVDYLENQLCTHQIMPSDKTDSNKKKGIMGLAYYFRSIRNLFNL
jgi:glycosyltransferase involved in cell wall biosynthesis